MNSHLLSTVSWLMRRREEEREGEMEERWVRREGKG